MNSTTTLADVEDVVNALAGSVAGGGVNTIYGQTITDGVIQVAIDDAEAFVYNLAGASRIDGFLADSDDHVKDLPLRACVAGAAVQVLEGMLGNIMVEDFTIRTGELTIDKGAFPQIINNAISTWKERRDKYQRMLQTPMRVAPQGATSPTSAGIPLGRDFAGYSAGSSSSIGRG